MSLFVDTSAWCAAADRRDTCHARAKAVLSSGDRLATSDHVLVETWLLLRHRIGRDAAIRFWKGIRAGVASVEVVREADLEAAWAIAEAWPDQDFSLADQTSFAVMLRLGIHRAATFDDDFAIFRFGARRDRAFEILR